ncbi:MAG: hypothetical protein JWO36_2893 [Myxococcales bacterium]|nr:hypothetical protein [Myxococcales bacterium]
MDRSHFSRLLAICAAICALPSVGRANPASIVPSIADPGAWVGVAGSSTAIFMSVDYEYEQDQSLVLREHVGDPGADPLGPLPTHHELRFKQFRHTVTPHVDVGLYHDLWISAALPIVIEQARELRLDTGVDRTASTFLDGIIPAAGYDARDPSTPPPGDLVFRGVNRHGLDQIHLGLGYAPMNQAKDDTKPTWRLGAEVRLAFGKTMKFDPASPSSETGVGYGVHELRLWTSFDRRLGWAEPWVELFWQTPIGTKSDSLFANPGFGATNTGKGQQAGVAFGFQAYAIDNGVDQNRISLDLGTRVVAHFEGRDYTEMWEPFALAGDSRGTGPLILDADPTMPGIQAMSHPGITNVENYLETAARFALRTELGPHVSFAALADIVWKTDHVITFADAGVDQPTCSATVTTGCETDPNDLVTPGTAEVNPLHSQRIDLVGHRYLSQDNFGFIIGVQGQVLF